MSYISEYCSMAAHRRMMTTVKIVVGTVDMSEHLIAAIRVCYLCPWKWSASDHIVWDRELTSVLSTVSNEFSACHNERRLPYHVSSDEISWTTGVKADNFW